MIDNLRKQDINETEAIGEDIKYDDDYLALCEEVRNIDSLEFNKKIDFDKIINISKEILEKKSKDITVSVYLSMALLKTNDIIGFASSIQIINDLLEKHGLDLYPKKDIAKLNAFSWWISKIVSILNNIENSYCELKQDTYDSLFSNLKFIDNFINSNFEERMSFSEVFALLNTKLILIEEKKDVEDNPDKLEIKKSDKEFEKSQSQINIYESLSVDTEELINFKDVPDILLKNLNSISHQIIKNENINIYLFLMNRIKIWFNIDKLPNNDFEITYIKAPESHEIEYLDNLYKEQNWTELLLEAESRIFVYPMWLDLHFYVYVSLKHQQIKDINIYISFIRSFIEKFPSLISLKFENEFNFANSSTKLWLNEILSKNNQNQSNVTTKNNLQKGYELVSNNQIVEAIRFFLQEIKESSTKKDETLVVIELVKIIKDYKYYDLTYHYLDYLLQITDDYKLSDWDPSLAAKIYKLVINANQTINYELDISRLNEIKKSLSVLDLESYIEIHNK